jgi:muconolactone delta-isomerase
VHQNEGLRRNLWRGCGHHANNQLTTCQLEEHGALYNHPIYFARTVDFTALTSALIFSA